MIQPGTGSPAVRQEFAEDVAELQELSKWVSESPEASLRLEDGHFKTGEVGKWRGRALSVAAFFMPFLRNYVDEALHRYSHETEAQQQAAVRHLNNMVLNSDNKPTALTERTVSVARAVQFIKDNQSNRSTAPKSSWVVPPTIAGDWRASPEDNPDLVTLQDNLELEYRVYTSDSDTQKKLETEQLAAEQQQKKSAEDFDKLLKKQSSGETIKKFEDRRLLDFKAMSDSLISDQTSINELYQQQEGSVSLDQYRHVELREDDADPVTLYDRSSDFHTEAETDSGVGHCTGRRKSMDDAVLCTRFTVETQSGEVEIKLTGVFDGHGDGGDIASEFAKNNIIHHLKKRLEAGNPESLDDVQIMNALKLAFVDTGNSFTPPEGKPKCGTTGNVVLQIGDDLWIANLGDSRAFLLDPDGKVVQLSEDAKPTDERYKKAIEKRGGEIDYKGRVSGAAVARDMGGHFAYGAMSGRPKVIKRTLPAESREGFRLVQGCDGLFDVANSDVVGGFVHQSAKRQASNAGIAGQLAELAYKAESMDNVSVVVTSL